MNKNSRPTAGFTLLEMCLSLAIFAVMIVMASPIIKLCMGGTTRYEAGSSLKVAGQNAINSIGHKLMSSQRIFDRSEAGTFLARIDLPSAALPQAYPDSKLPTKKTNGSLSPESASFDADSVGNSLFFAYIFESRAVQALDALSNPTNTQIDLYRFNYNYLGKEDGKPIDFTYPKRNLWEWTSVPYADFNQLSAITDATVRTNVINKLFTDNVLYAWDPSATNVANAFYSLTAAGTFPLPSLPAHNPPVSTSGPMVQILTGISLGGYHYSVCPNNSLRFVTRPSVPKFATASGNFPSGFEALVVGPSSNRQVFMRLVLVAEGSFEGNIVDEQVLLVSSRDLW